MISRRHDIVRRTIREHFSVSGSNLTNPWANYAGGNPMPTLAAIQGIGVYAHNIPFFPASTYLYSDLSNFHPPYMNQWNLSVQRQLGKDWLVTANYIGSNTIHMMSGENVNPAVFLGLGPCTIQTATGPVELFCVLHNRQPAKPARPLSGKPGNWPVLFIAWIYG